MTAPLPPNEVARLAKLRSLRVMDTLPEEEFDDIAEAAGALLDVPIALVSLVDGDRQWFKARRGLDLCDTPREIAICSYTILQEEPMIVPDLRTDPRFAESPVVTGPLGLRFYAGAPIVVDGCAVGTVCCADVRPREITVRQSQALAALARQVASLFRARLSTERLAESERRFTAFLDHAPAVAFLKDEWGRMRYVNRSLESKLGCSSLEVLGQTDHDWMPKDFADACARDDEAVRLARTVRLVEERVPVPGGTSQIWQTYKFPVTVDDEVWVGGVALDITALRDAESQIREQNEELVRRGVELSRALETAEAAGAAAQFAATRFEQLFAGLPIACFTFDGDGTIQEWNSAAETLWGVPSHEAFLRPVADVAYGESNRQAAFDTVRRVLRGETVAAEERAETLSDGTMRWLLSNTFPLRSPSGAIVGGMSAQLDVTERKLSESLLREKEERFRSAVESLHEGLVVQDESGRIVFWNRSAERILGMTSDEISGRTSVHPKWRTVREDGSEYRFEDQPSMVALVTGETQETSVMGVHRPDGQLRWLNVSAAPIVPDDGGRPKSAVASFLDVTERREQDRRIREYSGELEAANARLEALATTDGLTGLKNHRYFQDALREVIEAVRTSGDPLSIVLLDVDHFKSYNDAYGHQAGDAVLQGVAGALERALAGRAFAARYGGEEFVLVAPGLDEREAVELAQAIRESLAALTFGPCGVTASFGVATLDRELFDAPALIRGADEALYASKTMGRDRVSHWRDLGPSYRAA